MKRRLGGAAALFFQRLALAPAAVQRAESWSPAPGMDGADPRPGAREPRRDSAGLTGSRKGLWLVLSRVLGAAATLAPAPAFGTVPAGIAGVHRASGSGSGSQHPAAAPRSQGRRRHGAPTLSPPATSQGQRQCAAVRAAGGLGAAPQRGEAIFWADLQKVSTRGVISMLKHRSHALPTLPFLSLRT